MCSDWIDAFDPLNVDAYRWGDPPPLPEPPKRVRRPRGNYHIRSWLRRRDGAGCHYCGITCREDVDLADPTRATVDHVVPLSQGGTNARSNLVLACNACNHDKGGKPPPPRRARHAAEREGSIEVIRKHDPWPEAVSDGLTLSCQICGIVPSFDYRVSEDCWRSVVDQAHKLGVICLPCLDRIATKVGVDVSLHLEQVQFTGIGKTIIMKPQRVYRYEIRGR